MPGVNFSQGKPPEESSTFGYVGTRQACPKTNHEITRIRRRVFGAAQCNSVDRFSFKYETTSGVFRVGVARLRGSPLGLIGQPVTAG